MRTKYLRFQFDADEDLSLLEVCKIFVLLFNIYPCLKMVSLIWTSISGSSVTMKPLVSPFSGWRSVISEPALNGDRRLFVSSGAAAAAAEGGENPCNGVALELNGELNSFMAFISSSFRVLLSLL